MRDAAPAEARDEGASFTPWLIERTGTIEWSILPADVREITRQCVPPTCENQRAGVCATGWPSRSLTRGQRTDNIFDAGWKRDR